MIELREDMRANKLIGIVGMAGSGKSKVSDHLRDQGFPVIRFGQIIIDEMKRLSLEETSESEKLVRKSLRDQHGRDVCAKWSLPEIEERLSENHVVIDGLYSHTEYKTLRDRFVGQVVLLAVFVSKSIRYHRLAVRPVRPLTESEAEKRDFDEIEEIEKGGPIALADYMIINEGTCEELTERVDELMSTILDAHSKDDIDLPRRT